jgi:hypothetical protein
MSSLNTTATTKHDFSFQQLGTDANAIVNRQGTLGQSVSFTSGTGFQQINAVLDLQNIPLVTGSTYTINFSRSEQPAVDGKYIIPFSNIKSLAISNNTTGTASEMQLSAGTSNGQSSAFQEPFAYKTGGVTLKGESSWSYTSPYLGTTVPTGGFTFTITNTSVEHVTGAGATTGLAPTPVTFNLMAAGVSGSQEPGGTLTTFTYDYELTYRV